MILPEPRRDAVHQRGKAFLSTLVFVVMCYGVLLLASVSFEKPSRSIFREVDLASFAPPVITPEPTPTSEESTSPEEAPETIAPDVQEANTQSLDQLDLAQLFPEDISVSLDPVAPAENARNAQSANDSNEQIQVQSGGLEGLGSLDALDNFGGAPVPTARGRNTRQSGTGTTGGGIQLSDGSQSVSPDQGVNTRESTQVVGENTRRAATAEAADFKVDRLSLSSFGNDYDNLEIQDLMAWMKANPGTLPVGVRKLVRHRQEFLTSATSFEIAGTHYELFLMLKTGLYEVHIVLVDGDRATYLIDRSFQKLTTYLREGRVGRSPEQGITAINSRRTAASDDRSKEFYSLFLSWWEIAKNEN